MAGRPRLHNTTSGHCAVDLAALRRTRRSRGSLLWSNFQGTYAGVIWQLGADVLQLSYVSEGDHHSETIRLVRTTTAFGGSRQWLSCPGCHGRCRVVYRGSSGYRCRNCYRLNYPSQSEDAYWRTVSKSQSIRKRLGGTADLLNHRFPPKPKGMHWRTYRRHWATDAAITRRWTSQMALKLGLTVV